jgi:hypothetical protein
MKKIIKPRKLKNYDLLRMTPIEINEHNNKSKEYREFIINELAKESGCTNLPDMLFYVVEKYHEKLRQRAKQGRTFKWTRHVCSMLAVEIKHRDGTVDEAIEKLLIHPTWKKLIAKNDDGFETFKRNYKKGRNFKEEYSLSENLYLHHSKEEWNLMVEKAVNKAIGETTK